MSTRVRRTDPVVLFRWWDKSPTIHRQGIRQGGERVTECGEVVGPYKPILRYDHALLFGKPCRRCFPDA